MYSNFIFSESFEPLKNMAIVLSKRGVKTVIRKTPQGWSLEAKTSLDTIREAI